MSKKSKLKRSELGLNNDSKLDVADKILDAKVLASDLSKVEAEVPEVVPEEKSKAEEKEEEQKVDVKEEVKEVLEGSRVAAIDINLQYRKGDSVPKEVIARWELNGLDLVKLLEK